MCLKRSVKPQMGENKSSNLPTEYIVEAYFMAKKGFMQFHNGNQSSTVSPDKSPNTPNVIISNDMRSTNSQVDIQDQKAEDLDI